MVDSVGLFDLASQQARWLSARQATVAGNIANVNTPGYRASDIQPFEKVLAARQVAVSTTTPGHIPIGGSGGRFEVREQDAPNLLPSENSVVMENELIKANDVRRSFEINTAVVRSFHRMMMMTTRS